jgi:hypothetical protein
MNYIELQDHITKSFPGVRVTVDAPLHPEGTYHPDIHQEGKPTIVVEWKRGKPHVFGISVPGPDDYGTKPDEVYETEEELLRRVGELLGG